MRAIHRRFVAASLFVLASLVAVTAQAQDARAGQTCVAVMLPSVEGAEGSATDVATAVRDLFVSYLTGPSIRSIPLEARLPEQAALEAEQTGCGHMLIPSVEKKRRNGGRLGRTLARAAGAAVSYVPYGGAVATVGRAAAIGAAHALLYDFAAETRRKDQVTLGYRLGAPESVLQATPVTAKAKAKAKVDGEDLLTPLIERAAQEVLNATTRQ